MFWDIIGILAAICGTIYILPPARKALRYKSVVGYPKLMIYLWLAEKILSFTRAAYLQDPYFMVKYLIGAICVIIIAYYKFYGKKVIVKRKSDEKSVQRSSEISK